MNFVLKKTEESNKKFSEFIGDSMKEIIYTSKIKIKKFHNFY